MPSARRKTAILAAALAAVLAFGCGTAAGQRSLVDFRRSGGLVGFDDHLVVDHDGHARLVIGALGSKPRVYRGTVNAATRRRLIAALRHADLRNLNRRYTAGSDVRDAIIFQVTYRGRTVEAQDLVVPRRLQLALGILQEIATKLNPRY
jgi:hypothetical protein